MVLLIHRKSRTRVNWPTDETIIGFWSIFCKPIQTRSPRCCSASLAYEQGLCDSTLRGSEHNPKKHNLSKRRTNIQEANGRGHCKKLHPSFADEAHHHPPNQLNQSNLCVMLPHPSESPSGGRGLSCNAVELAVLLLLPQLLLLRCELRLASNQRPAGDVVRDIWDPRHLPP